MFFCRTKVWINRTVLQFPGRRSAIDDQFQWPRQINEANALHKLKYFILYKINRTVNMGVRDIIKNVSFPSKEIVGLPFSFQSNGKICLAKIYRVDHSQKDQQKEYLKKRGVFSIEKERFRINSSKETKSTNSKEIDSQLIEGFDFLLPNLQDSITYSFLKKSGEGPQSNPWNKILFLNFFSKNELEQDIPLTFVVFKYEIDLGKKENSSIFRLRCGKKFANLEKSFLISLLSEQPSCEACNIDEASSKAKKYDSFKLIQKKKITKRIWNAFNFQKVAQY